MIKLYIQATKPGIIFGNLISVIGGFLLASQGHIHYSLLLSTVTGMAFVIASSCVYNNYIDRDIDKKTERTKNRVLAKGLISSQCGLLYATILGFIGVITLYVGVNVLAMLIAIIGFIIYVGVYSLYMKRHSIYGTLIGSLSGATPPIIGYVAVSGHLEPINLILLIIFSLWQIPHSYSIAIFRLQDYKKTCIPILPVVRGVLTTKHRIIFYIIAFIFATLLLTMYGYTGYKYLVIVSAVNILWLCIALSGYHTKNNDIWARKVFLFSIIAITTISVMISIDGTRDHQKTIFYLNDKMLHNKN
ncbi:Protoheme IX farnesyltransferase [Candidatus Erwinia haradaeae]|uniref:Protoheme IX farnesyltransferase n=1 Tax=Candidatus Erwinia haradaeae TaxID=1922217 RepID=A0A451DDF5_9GAMM|nr:heme o synthase [Candidatus Erwinia haradaeae]VFP84474.1 Protoheme IX farnesyltransferase [Candidatus Erwinia haradaeae]